MVDDMPKTGARQPKECFSARTGEIFDILMQGARGSFDIVSYVRTRQAEPDSPWFLQPGETELSYSQIRRYIRLAEEYTANLCKGDRKKQLTRHLALRRSLFASAVQKGDDRAALQILDSEARLLGLFPKNTEREGVVITLNLEDLAQQAKQQLEIWHNEQRTKLLAGPIPAIEINGARNGVHVHAESGSVEGEAGTGKVAG